MIKFKPNEIILKDNYAEIIINSKKYGTLKSKIDLDDIEKVKDLMCSIAYAPHIKSFYVNCRNGYSNNVYKLHRLITNCKNNLVVDHINHDTLDNRKYNLRCISNMNNTQNKKEKFGINFEKQRGLWRARIGVNYKRIELGFFNTYEEALKVRLEAEKKYYNK